MKLREVLLVACLCWASVITSAFALDVYPGCDAPATEPGHNSFYVDPALGSERNDGSAAHPWRTLQEVIDPANHLLSNRGRDASGGVIVSGGPIGPGDVLYLMSGNHGSPVIAGALNSDFVSVVAAKDQIPVVNSLKVKEASHWLFRGIKFQGVRSPTSPEFGGMVDISSIIGPRGSDNIVFDDDSFSAEDSTSMWTPEDWVQRPYHTGLSSQATCTTVVDSHFYNLRDGMGLSGNRTLAQNNLIEDTGNDSIDMAASDVTIRRNRIGRGRHGPAEPLHPDAIQGWTLHDAINRHVVVDANTIVNLNPALDNMRQGISIFDGRWDGLVISNNLVMTNHWHGIALYGVANALVINNTVVPTRADRPTWITLHDSKDKTPSEHVIVRNNIAAQFILSGHDITVDHNIAQRTIEIATDGGPATKITKGRLGDHNIIDSGIFRSFVDFAPDKEKFDLRPSPVSPAFKAGSEDEAPPLDIDGRPRQAPPDIGAYAR